MNAGRWLVWALALGSGSHGVVQEQRPPPPQEGAEPATATAAAAATTRVLLLTGGVCHDFATLAPALERALESLASLEVEVASGLERLDDEHFADSYDVVVHHFCYDDAEPRRIDHALAATRSGKPTVMIHAAVHSFRDSERIRAWEECCGMRSKHHDPYQPFETEVVAPEHPILRGWPATWHTTGDELYQTIELLPGAEPLLRAVSPQDQRVHVVGWTHTYGKGRVFATTLGHDLATASQRAYQELLVRGIQWAAESR